MNLDIHARSDTLKGLLYSLAGAILGSTNFVTAKYGVKGFNPETFSLVWTSAAAVYTLLIVLATGHRRQLELPAYAVKKVALMGVVTGAGMVLSWAGLARLDPSFSAFLWRFSPVLTIVLSVLFLDEKLLGKEWVPIAVMFLGGCLSTVGRWRIVGVGTILTLLACFAASVQMLIAKMETSEIDPNILAFYRVGVGALAIALWTFLMGKADFDVAASYWAVTLLGAFLGPCAQFLFIFRSYQYWDLSRSSIVRLSQPLFVLPLAYFILGKFPTSIELAGGLLIMAGAFWLGWIHR